MKLKKILEIHHRYQTKTSLKTNLGDGYLLQKNPIYRKIRTEAESGKFKLSAKPFQNYEAFPLNELPEILSRKIIPYIDNVSALKKIEKKAPGVFELKNLPPLKGNQVFHEAAHAVAHPIIQALISKRYGTKKILEQNLAIKTLLEESFANACESISNIFARDAIHDEFLFKNSYVMDSPKTRKTLESAVKKFGFTSIFKLMVLSFLHANLLQTQINEQNIIRSLRIAFKEDPSRLKEINQKDIRLLTEVFRAGLDLDTEFTQFTNRFCLKLLGIKTELNDLFQFDFLSFFEHDKAYGKCLDELARIAAP